MCNLSDDNPFLFENFKLTEDSCCNLQVVVARLPPDYKARELIESYNASKAKKCCPEHGKELILRCITDGNEVCVDCVMKKHSGHQVEGIHKREHERLAGYWKSQNTELEVRVYCSRKILPQ